MGEMVEEIFSCGGGVVVPIHALGVVGGACARLARLLCMPGARRALKEGDRMRDALSASHAIQAH